MRSPYLLLLALSLGGCDPALRSLYRERVEAELRARVRADAPVLTEADLAPLPEPARRYLRLSGVLGRPRPRNFRASFSAVMRQRPGDAGMPSRVQQVDFFPERPTRLFALRARRAGLPVAVFHDYGDGRARMRVRAAALFNMVDLGGPALFKAECVTLLNDLCVLAPGSLAGPSLGWTPVDAQQCRVSFSNQGVTVRASLYFDADGRLVDFVSDDRAALQPDGSLKAQRFSTPLSVYKDFHGVWLASKGDAVWHQPDGPFSYGSFELRDLRYDVEEAEAF